MVVLQLVCGHGVCCDHQYTHPVVMTLHSYKYVEPLKHLIVCHHRHSQSMLSPKFVKSIVILCFERQYSKQNSVICVKSCI